MNTSAGSEVVLAFLIACCAKSTLLLAAGWFVTVALRRHSAAMRHQVWAAAIFGSLALPILVLLLPGWRSSVLGSAVSFLGADRAASSGALSLAPISTIVDVTPNSALTHNWPLAVFGLWAIGFCFVGLRLLAGVLRIAWISSKAKPLFTAEWMSSVVKVSGTLKIRRRVRLVKSGNPLAMPITWGFFRPVIMLPAAAGEWPDHRRSIVLTHELAHIARHDWLLQIIAELARAIYWFHPLVWLATGRLRQESERACDDAVLLSGIAPSNYASELLDLARILESSGRAWPTALAIARPSNLERRFAAMLNPSLDRRHLSLKVRFFVSFFVFCLLVPLAALRLPAQNFAGKTTGTIHDPSGGPVANATIVMSNHGANTIDMTTTDRGGNFSFKSLPAGKYELQVLKPGFKPYRVPEISLDSGSDFTSNFTLDVGAITEHVKVVPEDSTKPVVTERTSGKPSRLGIGGNVEAAKLVSKVQPVYPEEAKSAGVSGTVVLHAVIGMDGKPLSLRVMNSEIDPQLARSAVEAVSQWRYTPTLLNGQPIEVDTTITVIYSLEP